MAGTDVQALHWGCSGLSRGVRMCQGGGAGGKDGNCGILEGKEGLRKTPWYGMVSGRGSAGARSLSSVFFWGSVSYRRGINMSPVGMHREECCLVSEILCEKHPLMLKSLDCSLVCLGSRKSCC